MCWRTTTRMADKSPLSLQTCILSQHVWCFLLVIHLAEILAVSIFPHRETKSNHPKQIKSYSMGENELLRRNNGWFFKLHMLFLYPLVHFCLNTLRLPGYWINYWICPSNIAIEFIWMISNAIKQKKRSQNLYKR